MDFVSDQFYNEHRLRLLTLVDNHTRGSLAIHVTQMIRGSEAVEVWEATMAAHGKPQSIQADNDPELISKDVDLWAYWDHVQLDFFRSGKPTDNACIESFNSCRRQELNDH
ncbi:MAG: transposase family protein [Planctomycetes bacterium]|nr:transposase family protein [Planctomycetota bacterium]